MKANVNLLTVKQVCERIGLSRTAVYEGVAAGRLPRPVYPTPRAPRWRSDEIDAHIERLSEARAA